MYYYYLSWRLQDVASNSLLGAFLAAGRDLALNGETPVTLLVCLGLFRDSGVGALICVCNGYIGSSC